MKRTRLNFPIAVAQMRCLPGNVRQNLVTILAHIAGAKQRGAKLVVFPELATSGYLLGDRWEDDSFIREIEQANETIRKASVGLTVVCGSVRVDRDRIGEDGRVRKYNAALIASDGKWVSNGVLHGWIPKTNLPKYRIFDDARHFYPATKLVTEMERLDVTHLWQLLRPFHITVDGVEVKLGLAVCEDLWEDEYFAKPSQIYGMHEVDVLIDISQSPWTHKKWHARDAMLLKRSQDAGAPILYVNSVGLQNNTKNLVWFDGNSAFINEKGQFRWRAPQHDSGLYMLDPANLPDPDMVRGHDSSIKEIYDALIHMIREYFGGFPRVVDGLSGGIDSAVMLALLVEALGADRVIAINMPTRFNSGTTQDLARKCAKNFRVEYRVVPIEGLFAAQYNALCQAGFEPPPLAQENIQARIRGNILASIAQCEGGVFTCNGNKTEVALNYFTLYGDGAGAAAFLADLWKGQIYELARFINERAGYDIIPQGIIDIVPSAELSKEQNVDEGKGDPIFYPYHDQLLRMFIEQRWDPTKVLESLLNSTLGHDIGCDFCAVVEHFKTREALVENLEWAWRQYNIEWKRGQLPPVPVDGKRAFGFDRRDTIAPAYFGEEYYRLREIYLKKAV
jgi:NAD+ synthase (glutamine-hydrolysing)